MNTATITTQPTLGMWIPEVSPAERERNVYIRRFGLVSETAERYNDANLLQMPERVADACNRIMRLDSYSCEVFIVLALDKKSRLNGASIVTQGTLDAALVHPREVFQAALIHNAASIIVAHNHPSGDPAPSREDIEVTRKLIESGRILGIPLTDHVVIGDSKLFPVGGGFHSIRRSGFVAFD